MIATPRTDEIYTEDSPSGYPHPLDGVELARTLERELTAMTTERDGLRAWKESAMAHFAEMDVQAIGELLGLPLGSPIYSNIEPGIRSLFTRLTECWIALREILDSEIHQSIQSYGLGDIAREALTNTAPKS